MFKKTGFLYFCLFFLFALAAGASAQQQVRLGIMPFLSRTNEITANQAAQVADVITKILHVSPSISVIERERLRVIAVEQGLNMGSDNSAMKIGQLAGCEYILLGSVTQLTQRYLSSKKATQFLFSNFYGAENETQESTATLEARLIDVATGRVALSFSQGGSAFISSDDGKKSHSKGALATRAIEAAASRLGDKIREVLVNEYATIIAVNKKGIRINRGSASGVNIGSLYRVFEEGEELFDLDGKSLGKKSATLAIVRVADARSEFSTVEILEEQSSKKPESKQTKKTSKRSKAGKEDEPEITPRIHEGDRIEAISLAEAEKLKVSHAVRGVS